MDDNIKQSSHSTVEQAMLAAQRNMSNAKKDTNNPFFKSKYADLNSIREAVLPALMEQDILMTQPEVIIDGRHYVRTLLTHVPSGTEIHSDVEILMTQQNNPQALGSAITYARRYGLQSLCGIGADDDDGNMAAQQPKQPKPAQPQQSSAPITDDDVLLGCQEIKEAQTMQELQKTWARLKPLQAVAAVTQAKDKRKAELANAGS